RAARQWRLGIACRDLDPRGGRDDLQDPGRRALPPPLHRPVRGDGLARPDRHPPAVAAHGLRRPGLAVRRRRGLHRGCGVLPAAREVALQPLRLAFVRARRHRLPLLHGAALRLLMRCLDSWNDEQKAGYLDLAQAISSPAPLRRSHSFRSRYCGSTLSTSFQNAAVWSRWRRWHSSWTTM